MKQTRRSCGVYLANDIVCFDAVVKTPSLTRICGPIYHCKKDDHESIIKYIKMSLDNFSFNSDDAEAAKLWLESSKQLYKIIGVKSERAMLKITRHVSVTEIEDFLSLTSFQFFGEFRGTERRGHFKTECPIDAPDFVEKLFEAFSRC